MDRSLHERLVRLLEEGSTEPDFRFADDTPLISSGRIDSLALFNLTVWIENETGADLDLANLDPSKEWDTIADILDFIGRNRE